MAESDQLLNLIGLTHAKNTRHRPIAESCVVGANDHGFMRIEYVGACGGSTPPRWRD